MKKYEAKKQASESKKDASYVRVDGFGKFREPDYVILSP